MRPSSSSTPDRRIDLGARAETVYRDALAAGYNLRRVAAGVLGISLDETTTRTTLPRCSRSSPNDAR